MTKIKLLGLTALMSLYLGISSCNKEKKSEDIIPTPIDLSIHDLKKNIYVYEGKFVRTGAKVIDFKEMTDIKANNSESNYFNSSYMTLGDISNDFNEHLVSSHKYETQIDESNYKILQEFQSDINVAIRNESIIFVTGWVHSGVLDYTTITDSKGNLIFESKELERPLVFNGIITDIKSTNSGSSSEKYFNAISLDVEGKKLIFLGSSASLESYSTYKNAHVTIQSDKELWSNTYSLSNIDFDKNDKNIVQSKTLIDKEQILKNINQTDESIASYKRSFNSLKINEKNKPTLQNALNLRNLGLLVKMASEDYKKISEKESDNNKRKTAIANSEEFYDLAEDISAETTNALINHKSYNLAIELCRDIMGDGHASVLTDNIISDLNNNSEYYRSAKLAESYNRNLTSSKRYETAVTELAKRGLWSDALEVAEDSKMGAEKTLEIITNARSDIDNIFDKIRIGTKVVTASSYLDQKDKNSSLTNNTSEQNVYGMVVKLSDNYGRVIVDGIKIIDSDTTKIKGEFPVLFLKRASDVSSSK